MTKWQVCISVYRPPSSMSRMTRLKHSRLATGLQSRTRSNPADRHTSGNLPNTSQYICRLIYRESRDEFNLASFTANRIDRGLSGDTPEDFSLGDKNSSGVEAIVTGIQNTGHDCFLSVQVASKTLTVRTVSTTTLAIGDSIYLQADLAAIHFLIQPATELLNSNSMNTLPVAIGDLL